MVVDVLDEVYNLAGITPLVVVPGEEFDEVVVEHDTFFRVEDTGLLVTAKVGGDNLLVEVVDDALELAFGTPICPMPLSGDTEDRMCIKHINVSRPHVTPRTLTCGPNTLGQISRNCPSSLLGSQAHLQAPAHLPQLPHQSRSLSNRVATLFLSPRAQAEGSCQKMGRNVWPTTALGFSTSPPIAGNSSTLCTISA